VDFFDKFLRDQMLANLKKERQEREQFSRKVDAARAAINGMLKIGGNEKAGTINEDIIEAANYSLEGDGKRLRPIIAWFMGIDEYGLKKSDLAPLLRSLEYMHTASLIYDDLPSQDNATTRRGQTTLHQRYSTATAELTALFLTQKAMAEQAALTEFDEKTVLSLIRYSTGITAKMCQGQGMDLGSRGKPLTKAQLDVMAYYKTGIAFEAALVMPAMLAQVSAEEIRALKAFAHYLGMAFQIKDDLLDVEGNPEKTGKPAGLDEKNRNATYV
jgi:geranylgeranyl pyrophosphate synthase